MQRACSQPIKISGILALNSFTFNSKNNLIYKTYITQEMLKKNILAANSIYVSIAHKKKFLDRYFNELNDILKKIKKCEEGIINPQDLLESPICHSGFKRLN